MNSKPSRELAVFAAALELPAEDRGAYLARECGDDHALKARVETLLRADSEAGNFLEQPPPDAGLLSTNSIGEKPGDRIDRYTLLQQIGEGGCGVVFMAEQEEPVRRKVALKVIKPGMDTKNVIARFEAERQALALMDHPNIAKVFDAGATESGRPYFVMELVRGAKITEYCDKHSLNVEERLQLFIPVCEAIQHAHQKGVIHRDIKPSNILVRHTEQGNALPVVTVPVLVMHGEDDQIVPFGSSVPRAVEHLKNGKLKAYAGYPHGMLTTHADVLNPDLLAFIQS